MAESSTNDILGPGEIRFVDNYKPLWQAGTYAIKVTQDLKGSGAYQVDQSFKETQKFTVSGPRFCLNPADIQQMYPPPNSQGIFQHDLPHIVLTKRTLPWERSLFDDGTIPWMALLLFDASEILQPKVGMNAGSSSPTGVTTIKVGAPKPTTKKGDQDMVCALEKPEPKTMVGDYEWGKMDSEELEQLCQVIDIEPDTFRNVMPKREELKYLAHCREVRMDQKDVPGPGGPGGPLPPGNGTAWYAVVVGGRFPSPPPGREQTGQLNVVHLTSKRHTK